MNVEYIVSIKDSYGAEYLIQIFDNVEDAIAVHEVLDTPEELGKWAVDNIKDVDQYYINNPYKRFDVIITVEYY